MRVQVTNGKSDFSSSKLRCRVSSKSNKIYDIREVTDISRTDASDSNSQVQWYRYIAMEQITRATIIMGIAMRIVIITCS